MKAQWDEGGGRILLGDDTGGGRCHVVVGQVPVCWSSDFSCTPLYIHKYVAANSVPICAKLDLRRNFRKVATAGEEESLCTFVTGL